MSYPTPSQRICRVVANLRTTPVPENQRTYQVAKFE